MASETALNVPFDSQEIVQIVTEELQARMRNLSPLQGQKEYVSFSVDFQVKIKLRRAGEASHEAKETLAWGNVAKGDNNPAFAAAGEVEGVGLAESFDSRDPNEERMARDMPLSVQTSDGRGGKTVRKVKVKG